MAFFQEELSWFARLGRFTSRMAGRGKKNTPCQAEGPSLDDAEWRSFDLADVMEAGLARELTTSYTIAPPQYRPPSRLIVERSRDRSRHLLQTEGGEPLLLAICDEDDCAQINFYVPTGGDMSVALGPAFRLSAEHDNLDTWSLTTDRCECCDYLPRACCSRTGASACRRELVRVSQTREDFEQCSVMSMKVEMPVLRPDGSPSLWCERAGGSQGQQRLVLESRRPTWNKRLNSLTLDFHGRCSSASIQNFQLDVVADASEESTRKKAEPEILFGRIGLNRFALDYKHPLGMAQAFAIALTTNLWQ